MRWSLALLLFAFVVPAAAIDRQAFTVTRYQLEARIDRASHVMAVTGHLTLRNDSKTPQKIVALQVTSSFTWNAIILDDKQPQWLSANYTSDIDHTGSLTEAIVTLPREIPLAGTVTLGVQYGGTITPDASRLTRIGAPAETVARNEWDTISDSFTAVRGLGFVTWYPVAVDAVSLSDGNAVFEHRRLETAPREHRVQRALIVPGAEAESTSIALNSPAGWGESQVSQRSRNRYQGQGIQQHLDAERHG